MTLKDALGNRPAIYEIVPPRRDASRYNTELKGVEEVLKEGRITAINVPELINRRDESGEVSYSPATIPPEDYALLVKEQKEAIVNVVAPRLEKAEFLRRTNRILRDYKIPNIVVVGKEKSDDPLPGPTVLEALGLLAGEHGTGVALGGICIFDRETSPSSDYRVEGSTLSEDKRVWAKAESGCDFVTSQITFDPGPAVDFLVAYRKLCDKTGKEPLTVFVSLTTVPTPKILELLEGLDVVVPPKVGRELRNSPDMGRDSVRVAHSVFERVVEEVERLHIEVPIGLQIEQVGVNSGTLSLELLDKVYPSMG